MCNKQKSAQDLECLDFTESLSAPDTKTLYPASEGLDSIITTRLLYYQVPQLFSESATDKL